MGHGVSQQTLLELFASISGYCKPGTHSIMESTKEDSAFCFPVLRTAGLSHFKGTEVSEVTSCFPQTTSIWPWE